MTTTTTTTTTVNIDELFAKAIKSLDGGVIKYESDVLTTSAGQKFKIIIHQLVWYAVKLFVEVDPRLAADDLFVRFDGLAHIEQIAVSEHTALKGAEDKRDELLNDILSCVPPNFVKHLSEDDEVINHRFFLKVRHGKKVRNVEFIRVYLCLFIDFYGFRCKPLRKLTFLQEITFKWSVSEVRLISDMPESTSAIGKLFKCLPTNRRVLQKTMPLSKKSTGRSFTTASTSSLFVIRLFDSDRENRS